MTQKFSIKDIRRVESEVDEEIRFVSGNLRDVRDNQQVDLETAKKVGVAEVRKVVDRFNDLVGLRFAIREIVAKFNEENGINERTAKIARLEQEKAFLDDHVERFGRPGSSRDYHTDTIKYTPGITPEFVDEIRAKSRNIKRQIQRLKDSCNGINSNARFELDEAIVAKFESYGFIDKQ